MHVGEPLVARGSAAEESLLNSKAGTSFSNAQSQGTQAQGAFTNLYNNPGYTQSQINTQTNAAVTPIAGQVASAQHTLANRAAATRNDAGLVAAQDQAARTGAGQESTAAADVQVNAANKALQQQDFAAQGLSGLYGESLNSASNLYGVGQRAQATRVPSQYGISLGKLGNFGVTA
jgi:hypothetical protein